MEAFILSKKNNKSQIKLILYHQKGEQAFCLNVTNAH